MEEEGVHVDDTDLRLAQEAGRLGDLPGTFVQFDGEDVGEGDGDAVALDELEAIWENRLEGVFPSNANAENTIVTPFEYRAGKARI